MGILDDPNYPGFNTLTPEQHCKLALAGGALGRDAGRSYWTIDEAGVRGNYHPALWETKGKHNFFSAEEAYEAFWPRYRQWLKDGAR